MSFSNGPLALFVLVASSHIALRFTRCRSNDDEDNIDKCGQGDNKETRLSSFL